MPIRLATLYRSYCVPLSQASSASSVLPLFQRPPASFGQSLSSGSHIHTHNTQQPHSTSPAGNHNASGIATAAQPNQLNKRNPKELYWCIDRSWSEPPETCMSTIDVSQLSDDSSLFHQLNMKYNRIRGIPGWLFSWKRCHGVEFIKVRSKLTCCMQPRLIPTNMRIVLRDL